MGQQVVLVAEAVGLLRFGKECKVIAVNAATAEAEVAFKIGEGSACTVKLCHLPELTKCKQPMKAKTLNQLSRKEKSFFLEDAGLKCSMNDDSADFAEISGSSGDWLTAAHVSMGWSWMKWALALSPMKISCIDPGLSEGFMKVALEADDASLDALGEEQAQRLKVMMKSFSASCIFVPLYHKKHWVLLVLLKKAAEEMSDKAEEHEVMYFDSLPAEHDTSEACRQIAGLLLQSLSPNASLPDKSNVAEQKCGSATCGCFVLHWMEQIARVQDYGEPMSSLGWPIAGVWATRMRMLSEHLFKEQGKLLKEDEEKQAKDVKDKEKQAKKAKDLQAKKVLVGRWW